MKAPITDSILLKMMWERFPAIMKRGTEQKEPMISTDSAPGSEALRKVQGAMTFDEAWKSLNWDEWRMRPIKELIAELHRLTAAPILSAGPITPATANWSAAEKAKLVSVIAQPAPMQESVARIDSVMEQALATTVLEPTQGHRPMDAAPTDGTIVRLLVNFEDHSLEDEDKPVWTIGTCNFSNDGDPAWRFAGWNWSHDCFTEGRGKPIGWLPMLDATPPAQPAPTVQEPRAWLKIGLAPFNDGDVIPTITKPKAWNPEWWRFEPLYTPQPTAQRVPLTPEQVGPIALDFLRQVEAGVRAGERLTSSTTAQPAPAISAGQIRPDTLLLPVAVVETRGVHPDESQHGVKWLVPFKDIKDGDALYKKSPEQPPKGKWSVMVGPLGEIIPVTVGPCGVPKTEFLHIPDPCPRCKKGYVCASPDCGRLKLPLDHPSITVFHPDHGNTNVQQEPVKISGIVVTPWDTLVAGFWQHTELDQEGVIVTPDDSDINQIHEGDLQAVSEGSWKPHDLYTDADKDKPEQICDRDGKVVLSQCKRCGKAEIELSKSCSK